MTTIRRPKARSTSKPIRNAVGFCTAILGSVALLFTVAGGVAMVIKLSDSTLCQAEARQ